MKKIAGFLCCLVVLYSCGQNVTDRDKKIQDAIIAHATDDTTTVDSFKLIAVEEISEREYVEYASRRFEVLRDMAQRRVNDKEAIIQQCMDSISMTDKGNVRAIDSFNQEKAKAESDKQQSGELFSRSQKQLDSCKQVIAKTPDDKGFAYLVKTTFVSRFKNGEVYRTDDDYLVTRDMKVEMVFKPVSHYLGEQ